MNLSILLVEDDEDDIYILKHGFDELGFTNASFYTDAISAIKYLNSIDDDLLPQLIVTDFNLPAFNGYEFLKFLRRHPRFSELPVAVISTSVSDASRTKFESEGVLEIFIKPAIYDDYKAIAKTLVDMAKKSAVG